MNGAAMAGEGGGAKRSHGRKLPRHIDPPDAEAAAVVLTIVLGALPGPSLYPLVEVLEMLGLTAAPVFMADGRVNAFRLNVIGANKHRGWAIARETFEHDFYGRPIDGPAPWGLRGAAPRGRALADILLGLRGGA